MESRNISFCQPASNEEIDAMQRLRFTVYLKYGYIDMGNYSIGKDTDEFDAHSIHFVAMQNNEMLGTVRLIKHSELGFPIENNFELGEMPFEDVDRNLIVEVSRLVAKDSYPHKHQVLLGLIKSIYDYAIENGFYYWYMAVDNRVFRFLSRFGFALVQIGESRMYLGSMTTPSFIDIRAGIRYLEVANPDLSKFLSNSETNGKFSWFKRK